MPSSGAPQDFKLLETIKISSDGTIPLLRRHLDRLRKSAQRLGFTLDLHLLEEKLSPEVLQVESKMLRLLVARDGSVEMEIKAIPARNPTHLYLAPLKVSSGDTTLRHKTTRRDVYQRAREGCPSATGDDSDVLLSNEQGELTETTIANIAVLRHPEGGESRWVTPLLEGGVLAGVMRAELLESGRIVEGLLFANDLVNGETIRCFNAVRGVFDATFHVQ